MDEKPFIEFARLWKSYGEGEAQVNALAGVDLAINQGEFVTIMGPSGSGKSTAMNIIGCLDTPTSGDYRFMGVDAGRLDRARRALLRNLYIGFVFQGYNLLARTSAIDNVELPLIYRGAGRRERKLRAEAALDLVGLGGPHEPYARRIVRRSAAARRHRPRLVNEPRLVLADEPTGNLDTARSHEIMSLLTRLNEDRGLTVVMVTHEAEIAAYGSRTIRFVDGHIASDDLNKDRPHVS